MNITSLYQYADSLTHETHTNIYPN